MGLYIVADSEYRRFPENNMPFRIAITLKMSYFWRVLRQAGHLKFGAGTIIYSAGRSSGNKFIINKQERTCERFQRQKFL